jgi:hypothetical protein
VSDDEEPRRERRVRKARAAPPGGKQHETGPTEDGGAAQAGSAGDGAVSAAAAARAAARHVADFTGRHPESVVSIDGTDDGWTVGVEVVETHRIPDTTDVLAIYEVSLDRRAGLRSYRRTRRYARGQLDERCR